MLLYIYRKIRVSQHFIVNPNWSRAMLNGNCLVSIRTKYMYILWKVYATKYTLAMISIQNSAAQLNNNYLFFCFIYLYNRILHKYH